MSIYNRDYYLRHLSYSGTKTERDLNLFRASLVRKGQEFVSVEADAILVDWGCSHGAFLDVVAARGFTVIGVDINEYCNAHCTYNGHKAFTPDMFEHFYKNTHVSIMTFWDSFEHVLDPGGLLKKYQPEIACMSLPCLDGWLESHPGKDISCWKHYRVLEHLHTWSAASFVDYLDVHGYYAAYTTFDESKIRVDTNIGEKNIMSFVAVRK